MAARKPLVIVSGQIQQLQTGDTLNCAVSTIDASSLTNDNASTINICQAVYVKSNGHVDLAEANASGTCTVFGLVQDTSIATSVAGNVQTDGIFTATTTQWDAVVTGESGGLTPGSIYYLDPATAGKLTTTAPTTAGQYVVQVGIAESATTMKLWFRAPILL
jgi:hypothetical protein